MRFDRSGNPCYKHFACSRRKASLEDSFAGFNSRLRTIQEVRAASPGGTLHAGRPSRRPYARISRNPAPVNALRLLPARSGEARRSNQAIVSTWGTARCRHAVSNIDVLGVGRLLVEGDREVPPVLLHEKVPALRAPAGRLRHPPGDPRTPDLREFHPDREGPERILPPALRGPAPWSSTRTGNLPPHRRTAPCWKDGQGRCAVRSLPGPRRPSSA